MLPRLVDHLVRSCRLAHDRALPDDGSQPDLLLDALPHTFVSARPASRHIVVDAILGIRCGYDPTVKRLTDLPQDVLLRIFSTLPTQSLCSLGARRPRILASPSATKPDVPTHARPPMRPRCPLPSEQRK